MADLPQLPAPHTDVDFALAPAVAEAAKTFARASRAESTRRQYAGDVRRFEAWCRAEGRVAFPATAATVVSYVTWLATVGNDRPAGMSTIDRALAAIGKAHELAAMPWPRKDPRLLEVVDGMRREKAAPPKKKRALLRGELLAMLGTIQGDGLRAKRDRAILLLGWTCALRRAELARLDMSALAITSEGFTVTIGKSKGDQTGRRPRFLYVRAGLKTHETVTDWLAAAGITTGPLFRAVSKAGVLSDAPLSSRLVAEIAKTAAERVGIDPRHVGGHSLRSGWATQAAQDGVRLEEIMEQTGHQDVETVMGYVRAGRGFQTASAQVGL